MQPKSIRTSLPRIRGKIMCENRKKIPSFCLRNEASPFCRFYHIHGVVEVQPGIFDEVADSEAQCFGLYVVSQTEQGKELDWISDHPTRADAEQAMLALQNRA